MGTAAEGSEQGTARVDSDRRGPVAGAAGMATPRHDAGGWRCAEYEEGASQP